MVYATTREDNIYIQKALTKFGFIPKGDPFPSNRSDRKEDYNVCLFVRENSKISLL